MGMQIFVCTESVFISRPLFSPHIVQSQRQGRNNSLQTKVTYLQQMRNNARCSPFCPRTIHANYVYVCSLGSKLKSV